jgi:hypothetical protein
LESVWGSNLVGSLRLSKRGVHSIRSQLNPNRIPTEPQPNPNRPQVCEKAFCEDHVPEDHVMRGECEMFKVRTFWCELGRELTALRLSTGMKSAAGAPL